MKTISIIACGWLGLPLAADLAKKGYHVKGSATTASKLDIIKEKGIAPYLIELGKNFDEDWKDFLETDLLIVCIPPSSSDDPLLALQQIRKAAENKGIQKLLYTSATSVYPSDKSWVTETQAEYIKSPHSGVEMKKLEDVFTESEQLQPCILRLAGLFGGNRWMGKYLAGKTDLPNGDQPVNLIHLDDCIGLIERIIEKEAFPGVFNGCSDEHPTRKEFYKAMAEFKGWDAPHFKEEPSPNNRKVSNAKIKEELGYSFKYPNPIDAMKKR